MIFYFLHCDITHSAAVGLDVGILFVVSLKVQKWDTDLQPLLSFHSHLKNNIREMIWWCQRGGTSSWLYNTMEIEMVCLIWLFSFTSLVILDPLSWFIGSGQLWNKLHSDTSRTECWYTVYTSISNKNGLNIQFIMSQALLNTVIEISYVWITNI